MNQIYGYGKTILCKQPVTGKWYDHIKCNISFKHRVISAGASKKEYEMIVTAKEFCTDCPCNQGEVNIYWQSRDI